PGMGPPSSAFFGRRTNAGGGLTMHDKGAPRKTTRLLPLLALPALALVAPGAAPPRPAGEDAKLRAFFRAFLEEELKQRPLEATRLGDRRFDHLLDDVSAPARGRWKARYAAALADLPKKVSYAGLTRDGQIDYEILKHHLTRELWLMENTKPFEDD